MRPERGENTVDRADGTFKKYPYQQFLNFFLVSIGFLITRKKRPAVRDRYYDMETKTENPLKLFFCQFQILCCKYTISFSKSRIKE